MSHLPIPQTTPQFGDVSALPSIRDSVISVAHRIVQELGLTLDDTEASVLAVGKAVAQHRLIGLLSEHDRRVAEHAQAEGVTYMEALFQGVLTERWRGVDREVERLNAQIAGYDRRLRNLVRLQSRPPTADSGAAAAAG